MDLLQPLAKEIMDATLEAASTNAQSQQDNARWWCGRWLAHRRMQKGLTPAMAAQRIGLDEASLCLLEAGVFAPRGTADEIWYRLCLILEQNGDLDWVASVLYNALGYPDSEQARVLNVVMAQVPLERGAAQPYEVYRTEEDSGLRPEVFHMLRVLRGGALSAFAIKQELAQLGETHAAMGMITIHTMLEKLYHQHLVERANIAVGAQNVDEEYYLTPNGRELIFSAMQRQSLVWQRRKLDNEVQQVNQSVVRLATPSLLA